MKQDLEESLHDLCLSDDQEPVVIHVVVSYPAAPELSLVKSELAAQSEGVLFATVDPQKIVTEKASQQMLLALKMDVTRHLEHMKEVRAQEKAPNLKRKANESDGHQYCALTSVLPPSSQCTLRSTTKRQKLAGS